MASIYGLFDQQGRLRYVGKANDPEKRVKTHMRDARRRDNPLHRWLRKNGTPRMEVLVRDTPTWREDERILIAGFREQGEPLLNVAEGGDQPFVSIEQRRANARTLNARLRSDPTFRRLVEIKRRLGASLAKGWISDAAREKMRLLAVKRPDMFGDWSHL